METGTRTERELTSRELGDIVDKINRMLNKGQFKEYDQMLESFDPSKMLVQEMIAYSRCSFMARNKLKYWKTFVAECSSELSDRGLQGHRILQGLL